MSNEDSSTSPGQKGDVNNESINVSKSGMLNVKTVTDSQESTLSLSKRSSGSSPDCQQYTAKTGDLGRSDLNLLEETAGLKSPGKFWSVVSRTESPHGEIKMCINRKKKPQVLIKHNKAKFLLRHHYHDPTKIPKQHEHCPPYIFVGG